MESLKNATKGQCLNPCLEQANEERIPSCLAYTIDKELPDDGMTFLDPITKKPHSRLADAFVDDTMFGKSDSGDLLYKDLILRQRVALLICKGLNRHFPRQITHGPQVWGGLGILDLKTEGGLSQIKEFCHALYGDSEPGKLVMYSLKYSQMESGLGFHLLEDPTVFISWLTPTWIVRQFLYNHNITITLTDC